MTRAHCNYGPRPKESTPERELRLIRALIANDSYAATFQNMGQYRRALLKSIVSMERKAA